MTARLLLAALLALAIAAALALVDPAATATGWRAGFLTAGAPVLGAALLLAIGRTCGTDWDAFTPFAASAPLFVLFALPVLLAPAAAPLPDHLAIWENPVFVTARTGLAVAAWSVVGLRLAAGASRSFAAVALSSYVVLVTIVASDWMLGGSPSQANSAIGMMLAVEQIGGGCAALLLAGLGTPALRRDMSQLLVAAALGLSYLAFMDYLIVWYGNLPSRVGWYVARGTPPMSAVAGAALGLGLGGPIVALTMIGSERGRRIAGTSALAGLFLFNLWFVGGGLIAAAAALLSGAGMALATWAWAGGKVAAHG